MHRCLYEGQMRKTQETPRVTRCLSGPLRWEGSHNSSRYVYLLSHIQTSVLHFCRYSLTTSLREETACAEYLLFVSQIILKPLLPYCTLSGSPAFWLRVGWMREE